MRTGNKKESLILLLGDIVAFFVALWLSLLIRNFETPSFDTLYSLAIPFSIISIIWIIFFFIAGLYEKQRIAKRKRLPELLLKTQIFNSIVAILFFYSLPYFGVAPKTILFFYIIISLALSFIWRVYAVSLFSVKTKSNALMIAGGPNAEGLRDEINQNTQYSFRVARIIDTEAIKGLGIEEIGRLIKLEKIKVIIIDSRSSMVSPILPDLYKLIFLKMIFIDFYDLYEDVFDRLPVSQLQYSWFLENFSTTPHAFYDAMKRFMDVLLSVVGLILTLPFTLLATILLKIEGGDTLFSFQDRVGQFGRSIRLIKFRTMTYANAGELVDGRKNEVTKVGKFLRKTRIDEFPQFLNVLRGDVSLIGPRPEFRKAVDAYSKELPYYGIRHMIKPGLSGWAQIYGEHPHHDIDIEETKNKLSYDLFYVKNRSFPLDIIIALKTIKTLLSREGI
ncbi:MAG: sugar transferase [Patescibacteria group bacterium]